MTGTWASDRVVKVTAPTSKVTFTLDGTSYTVEEGTTWRQWYDSGKAPSGLCVDGGGNPSYVRLSMGTTWKEWIDSGRAPDELRRAV